MKTLTPKQIVETQLRNADMAASYADALLAVIRNVAEGDRPDADHLLALASDYKKRRDEERVSRNTAHIVRHAVSVHVLGVDGVDAEAK